MSVTRVLLLASLVSGCDGDSKRQAAAPPVERSHDATGTPASPDVIDDPEHADAHPPSAPPHVATATALGAEARSKLTTLRVMAHIGAVIVRKEHGEWWVSGPSGCRVQPARIERALDNLANLRSEPATERPRDGSEFELQVIAQIGQERALHFDMAGRVAGRDLVQLGDYSTFWISGFDRDLWAPQASAWCTAR